MISVVIPLYNKSHTIERTLTSVLEQSYKDFEVIIIDDGSTDNSVEVIENFTEDRRIKIFNQENLGASVARNRGVKEAAFNYIAFLDGDDEWLPEYLNTMIVAIKQYPQAGMYCCAGFVRNSQGERSKIAKKYNEKIVEIQFFQNPHVFLHTSSTVVSKIEFNNTSGFPVGMNRNEDFALFYSLALITPVVYCGYKLSVYNGDIEGQATETDSSKVISHIVDRHNWVFNNWQNTGKLNKDFLLFFKYELRHFIINKLRNCDYKSIIYFYENIDPGIKRLFPKLELAIYQKQSLRQIGKFYLLLTKLRWRLRGHPRVN